MAKNHPLSDFNPDYTFSFQEVAELLKPFLERDAEVARLTEEKKELIEAGVKLAEEVAELKAQIIQRDANYVQLQKWADTELAQAKEQGRKEVEAAVDKLNSLGTIVLNADGDLRSFVVNRGIWEYWVNALKNGQEVG